MSADRHATSRRMSASPAEIFAIVCDPATHAAIDGSGMVEAAIDARPVTAVGDTFDMDMDRTPLNDIPGLVKYQVRNLVTGFEQDRLVEWTTGGIGMDPVGHVYGWELEPAADGGTNVTHYCDWSGISDEMRSQRAWPVVPLHMLETSIANLDGIVAGTVGG